MARSQLNIRLDKRTAELLQLLEAHLNLGATAVLRLAVARLAAQEQLALIPASAPSPSGPSVDGLSSELDDAALTALDTLVARFNVEQLHGQQWSRSSVLALLLP